jgi:hypothetical protein
MLSFYFYVKLNLIIMTVLEDLNNINIEIETIKAKAYMSIEDVIMLANLIDYKYTLIDIINNEDDVLNNAG